MADRYIGDRWLETFDRCDKLVLVVGSEMADYELEFVKKMRDNLALYKGTTYMTAKQLNWLTRLESKYGDRTF